MNDNQGKIAHLIHSGDFYLVIMPIDAVKFEKSRSPRSLEILKIKKVYRLKDTHTDKPTTVRPSLPKCLFALIQHKNNTWVSWLVK